MKAKRQGKPLDFSENLSVAELHASENHLFHLAQERHFYNDWLSLS